ncbi:MAG: tetratricopeptide repeat protein [Planctomycetes bacterium]|nr:tetratricopeptide repeat protein [Planctomycetota bacterium]
MIRGSKAIALSALTVVAAGCAKPDYNPGRAQYPRFKQTRTVKSIPSKQESPPSILPQTHFAAGNLLEQQGQISRAIVQYRKAVAVNHNFARGYHRLGRALGLTGKRREAITALSRAAELKPGSAVVRNDLGYALMHSKRWEEAEAELLAATEIQPDFARAYINLGLVLSRTGRFDEAYASFRTVLPEPDAYYNLGLMYRGQGQYDKAADTFRRVLAIDENFSAARTQLKQVTAQLNAGRQVAEPSPVFADAMDEVDTHKLKLTADALREKRMAANEPEPLRPPLTPTARPTPIPQKIERSTLVARAQPAPVAAKTRKIETPAETTPWKVHRGDSPDVLQNVLDAVMASTGPRTAPAVIDRAIDEAVQLSAQRAAASNRVAAVAPVEPDDPPSEAEEFFDDDEVEAATFVERRRFAPTEEAVPEIEPFMIPTPRRAVTVVQTDTPWTAIPPRAQVFQGREPPQAAAHDSRIDWNGSRVTLMELQDILDNEERCFGEMVARIDADWFADPAPIVDPSAKLFAEAFTMEDTPCEISVDGEVLAAIDDESATTPIARKRTRASVVSFGRTTRANVPVRRTRTWRPQVSRRQMERLDALRERVFGFDTAAKLDELERKIQLAGNDLRRLDDALEAGTTSSAGDERLARPTVVRVQVLERNRSDRPAIPGPLGRSNSPASLVELLGPPSDLAETAAERRAVRVRRDTTVSAAITPGTRIGWRKPFTSLKELVAIAHNDVYCLDGHDAALRDVVEFARQHAEAAQPEVRKVSQRESSLRKDRAPSPGRTGVGAIGYPRTSSTKREPARK